MKKLYCIAVRSESQLDAEIISAVDYIIFSPAEYNLKTVRNFSVFSFQFSVPVFLDLPAVAMSKDMKILRGILSGGQIRERLAGVVANNVYALTLADEYGLKVFKGMEMNTLNDNFCPFENIVLSPELYEKEYRLFKDWDKKNYFLCVYGYLPLMTLAHCPYKINGFDCKTCGQAKLQYKDELNNVMNISRVKISNCYFKLLNSVPLDLLKYKNQIKPHYYFDMRETDKETIKKILRLYKEPGNKDPDGKHTTGLYFKDVK